MDITCQRKTKYYAFNTVRIIDNIKRNLTNQDEITCICFEIIMPLNIKSPYFSVELAFQHIRLKFNELTLIFYITVPAQIIKYSSNCQFLILFL